MSIEFFVAAVAVCLLIGLVGRIGLRLASADNDMISWPRTLIPAFLGGMSLAVLQTGTAGMGDSSLIFLCITGLGAALGVGAIIDRETGWAPDALMAVLAAKAMVLGTIVSGWPLTPLQASLFGLGILVAINLVWIAAVKLTGSSAILPPADILAFALPFMIFGMSIQFVLIMLAIAVLGLACMRLPVVAVIFTNPDVRDNVLREHEIDYIKAGQGLTLLSIALPATWLAILTWFI